MGACRQCAGNAYVPATALGEFFEVNTDRRDPRNGLPDVERAGDGHSQIVGNDFIKAAACEVRQRLFDFRKHVKLKLADIARKPPKPEPALAPGRTEPTERQLRAARHRVSLVCDRRELRRAI